MAEFKSLKDALRKKLRHRIDSSKGISNLRINMEQRKYKSIATRTVAIRIPASVLDKVGYKHKDVINLTCSGNRVVLEPAMEEGFALHRAQIAGQFIGTGTVTFTYVEGYPFKANRDDIGFMAEVGYNLLDVNVEDLTIGFDIPPELRP